MDYTYVYVVSICLLIRASLVLSVTGMMYVAGIEHDVIATISSIEGFSVLSVILMVIAINKLQPFFCVPFVVIRTMETFAWICLIGAVAWAAVDSSSETFLAIFVSMREIARKIQLQHVDIKDLTWQICIVLIAIGGVALAASCMATRVAWVATTYITDAVRREKYFQQIGTKRITIASDELYTNY